MPYLFRNWSAALRRLQRFRQMLDLQRKRRQDPKQKMDGLLFLRRFRKLLNLPWGGKGSLLNLLWRCKVQRLRRQWEKQNLLTDGRLLDTLK